MMLNSCCTECRKHGGRKTWRVMPAYTSCQTTTPTTVKHNPLNPDLRGSLLLPLLLMRGAAQHHHQQGLRAWDWGHA
jgi:hypothetical protein